MVVTGALSISQDWAGQALEHQLRACRGVSDSAARLECLDRMADAASTTTPPDSAPPVKSAGVESSIVGISQQASGRADFTLANGQMWRQMDPESAKSAKVGDRVAVSKAFLGAYWLKIEGGPAWRVTLLK